MTQSVNQDLVWLEPQTPDEIVNELITKHRKNQFYVLFSGGKDSVCVAHFIATNYPEYFGGVVFTNVGLGSQQTRKFVIGYCKEMGWNLIMTWPKDSERFYNIVMKHGFAGAGNHKMWMGYLKYHTWREFVYWRQELGEHLALVSGVRKKESNARNKIKQYSKTPVDIDGRMIFIKPFLYYNGVQLWNYFGDNALKKSPTYDWFNKSGECFCGSHAEQWELKLLEQFDKLAFDTIKWLERQIQIHGTAKAKKYPQWGNGPKTEDIENQSILEDYCGESCVA